MQKKKKKKFTGGNIELVKGDGFGEQADLSSNLSSDLWSNQFTC